MDKKKRVSQSLEEGTGPKIYTTSTKTEGKVNLPLPGRKIKKTSKKSEEEHMDTVSRSKLEYSKKNQTSENQNKLE